MKVLNKDHIACPQNKQVLGASLSFLQQLTKVESVFKLMAQTLLNNDMLKQNLVAIDNT